MMTTFKEILIAFALTFTLLWVASDNMPENTPMPPTCSCNGEPGCEEREFDPYGQRKTIARCAIRADGTSCCVVPPSEGESE